MSSFNVVVPTQIHRLSVRHRVIPGDDSEKGADGKPAEVAEELLYDGGFEAGYAAGQWKAEKETREAAERQAAEVAAALHGLQVIQTELLKQAQQNFPPLVMAAVERVFKNHKITDAEVGGEIAALLKDVVHAQSISIECSSEDLDRLQRVVEGLGLMLQKGAHSWKMNPTLKRGEFILQTDLGTVDGRRLTKLNKIKAALQVE
jgi:flagellar biosynthesis/type III secretory pathway protein FliH